jgi:hypothetical protein
LAIFDHYLTGSWLLLDLLVVAFSLVGLSPVGLPVGIRPNPV